MIWLFGMVATLNLIAVAGLVVRTLSRAIDQDIYGGRVIDVAIIDPNENGFWSAKVKLQHRVFTWQVREVELFSKDPGYKWAWSRPERLPYDVSYACENRWHYLQATKPKLRAAGG